MRHPADIRGDEEITVTSHTLPVKLGCAGNMLELEVNKFLYIAEFTGGPNRARPVYGYGETPEAAVADLYRDYRELYRKENQ